MYDARWVVMSMVCVVGFGCSASTSDSASRSGAGTNLGTTIGSNGGRTGTGGTIGSTMTGSGFGNSTAPVQPTTPHPASGAAGTAGGGGPCMDGMFCAPTGADMGCGTLTLASTVKKIMMPGNVLIIFDRSTSMNQDWNGMGPKWQVAGNAVVQGIMPLQDQLTMGAILFPGVGSNPLGGACDVHPITDPDQIDFMPATAALMKFMGPGPNNIPTPSLYGAPYGLSETPTAEAVKMADMALMANVGKLKGTIAVILITDGEPNCMWDQNATVTTVGNWLSQSNIKTYVIGLPGVNGKGPAVLNAIAQAGGTMMYLMPDPMTLQQKIMDIVVQAVSSGFDSCSIDLMPPTSAPDKLQLVVEETSMPGMLENVPHDLGGTAGGWTISADGSHVDISGPLCDSAKSGKFTKLTFQFGCKDIPPIPPSHVQ
jgi:hypothetical protein